LKIQALGSENQTFKQGYPTAVARQIESHLHPGIILNCHPPNASILKIFWR